MTRSAGALPGNTNADKMTWLTWTKSAAMAAGLPEVMSGADRPRASPAIPEQPRGQEQHRAKQGKDSIERDAE